MKTKDSLIPAKTKGKSKSKLIKPLIIINNNNNKLYTTNAKSPGSPGLLSAIFKEHTPLSIDSTWPKE